MSQDEAVKVCKLVRVALLGAGLVIAGCEHAPGDVAECGASCGACAGGECSTPEVGWRGPVLLWSGPEAEAPSCPEAAPAVVFEGRAGLEAQLTCPACTCGPPSCMLPEGIILSDVYDCMNYDQPGATVTHYMAPEGWTGECISPAIVPQEHTVARIRLPSRVSPCAPIAGPGAASTVVTWTTMARACEVAGAAAAADPPPAAFSRCVFQEGELAACPAAYPERQVFFRGVTSTLSCSPCTCGPPQGSVCVAYVRVHHDDPCSEIVYSVGLVGLMDQECDLSPGGEAGGVTGISAVLASLPPPNQNDPGTCTPSGGKATGEATPADPATFCCAPLAAP
jgi:hypothetical protein